MLTTLSIMQKQPNIFGEEKTCLQDKLTRTAPNALKADFQSSHEASCEDWKSAFKIAFKVARYSYHKNPAQESRTQNRVTIFTRRSRKLINKMKELPK
jgi:hypothetical protein